MHPYIPQNSSLCSQKRSRQVKHKKGRICCKCNNQSPQRFPLQPPVQVEQVNQLCSSASSSWCKCIPEEKLCQNTDHIASYWQSQRCTSYLDISPGFSLQTQVNIWLAWQQMEQLYRKVLELQELALAQPPLPKGGPWTTRELHHI